MSHASYPPMPNRLTSHRIASSAPDPAEFGTAYGMELSMTPVPFVAPAADPEPLPTPSALADLQPEPDPLNWIRRWLDRHADR